MTLVECGTLSDGFLALSIDSVKQLGGTCSVATTGRCPPRFDSHIEREFRFRNVFTCAFGFPQSDILMASRDYLADQHGWLMAIEDSPWLWELRRQNALMYEHGTGAVFERLRHFILSVEDSTFECLAAGPVECDVDIVFGRCR